jgi:hypothetical protein
MFHISTLKNKINLITCPFWVDKNWQPNLFSFMEYNAIFEIRRLQKNAGQAFLVSDGKLQSNNNTGFLDIRAS